MATGKLAKRYNPLQLLGAGAMGEVWLVEDTLSGDRLAMKIISRALAGREKSLLQFRQEFHLMTQLQHPNCCEVFDFGQLPDGSPFFTMAYVTGEPLSERVPLGNDEARHVLTQLLMALGHLHRRELVHRDIKAENVRLMPDGKVKLMDFGLMEYAGRAGGGLTGTFPYLAPEIVLQAPVDQRSDLYALGVLAYEMVSGRLPFIREKPREILKAHVQDLPDRPSRFRQGIDPVLERVVLKLLEKNPVDRYQNAYEVLAALGAEVPSGIGGHLLSSPLIGHEGARAALRDQLRRVAAGQPGETIVLTGETGLGKSRLAREYRYTAQLEGVPCAQGACREQGQSPYDPVVSVVRGLIPLFKEYVRADLDRLAPILVKLLPELGAAGGHAEIVPAADLDPPSSEKARLQGTVVDMLVALAQRRSYVLVLEDTQWADPLSIELFQHLRRALVGCPVGILLTSRQPEQAAQGGTGRIDHLPLFALPRLDLEAMVSAMLGTREVATRFYDQVEQFSRGNPLFIERLLEHLVQEDILVNRKGWNTAIELTEDRLPASLQALLLLRVESLPPDARALARIVAVLGRPTGIDLLQEVSELGEGQLFSALQALLVQHVLVQTDEGAYEFGQDQFQTVIYQAIAPKNRIPLHAAVAAALEQLVADRPLAEVPMELVMAIAAHHMLASDAYKTVRYALEAGVRNAQLYAPVIAERFLQAGFEVLATIDGPEWDPIRLEYLRWLGDTHRMLGKYVASRDAYLQALPLAQALDVPQLYGHMACSMAKTMQCLGDYPEATEWARRAQLTCQAAGDPGGAARAHLTSARLRTLMGEIASAVGHTLRAEALAREAEDGIQVGQALAWLGYLRVTHQRGQVSEGLAALTEALGLLAESGDKMGLLYAQSQAGDAHQAVGDLLAAQDAYSETRRLAEEVNAPPERCGALMNLANIGLELGNFWEATSFATAAATAAAELPDPYTASICLAIEGAGHAAVGDFARASEVMAQAVAGALELANPYVQMLVGVLALELDLDLGQLGQARERALFLEPRLRDVESAEHIVRFQAVQCQLHAYAGEWEAASAAAVLALGTAQAAEAAGLEARARYVLAWLALRRERWNEAREEAGRAWAIATRIHAKPLATLLHQLLGEAALATGEGNPTAHFQAMTLLAEAMGSPLARALAMFGASSAAPYAPDAARRAGRAREILFELVEDLTPEAREAFLQAPERERVWEGNFIDFSLPVYKPKVRGTGALRPDLWRLE